MPELRLTSNSAEIEAAFAQAPERVGPALVRTTREYGYKALQGVKRRVSGRPGPNVITGDYRRSWYIAFSVEQGDLFAAVIFNNSPQGPRLEYGFHGRDSLGRLYRQKALPHLAPTFRELSTPFILDIGNAARKALGGAA